MIIVGGGLAGLHSAYEFCQRGWKVKIVDSGDISATDANAGSLSPGSYGLSGHPVNHKLSCENPFSAAIKMSHRHSAVISWNLRSGLSPFGLWWNLNYLKNLLSSRDPKENYKMNHELQKRSVKKYLEMAAKMHIPPNNSGGLIIYKDQDASSKDIPSCIERARSFKELALPLAETAWADEPLIQRSGAVGLSYPDDLAIDSLSFKKAVRKYLKSKGVEFFKGKVEKILKKDSEISEVIVNGNSLKAAKYLFTVGAFNHPKMNIWTYPAYGIGAVFASNEPIPTKIFLPHILSYLTPEAGDIRATTGMFFGFHGISKRKLARVTSNLKREIESNFRLKLKTKEVYVGARPMSADGLPIVGKHPFFSNAFVLNGLGTYGHTAAAASEILANQIEGWTEESSGKHLGIDATQIAPSRFSSFWSRCSSRLLS